MIADLFGIAVGVVAVAIILRAAVVCAERGWL